MPNASTDNYTLGKGIGAFGAKQGDGSYAAPMDLGNIPEVNLSVDIETLAHFSSRSGVKKKDKEITVSTSPKIAFVTDEISPENTTLGLMGERTAVTQTSGTAESASITASIGAYFDLGKRKVSNVVITGKTAPADFQVYPNLGYIFIPWGTSITEGEALTVSFDCAAVEYSRISAFTQADIEGKFLYLAQNPAGPEVMSLEFWRVALKLSGDVALIGDDWMTLPMEGEILSDEANHPDEPYCAINFG